jgi:hypothetical protein
VGLFENPKLTRKEKRNALAKMKGAKYGKHTERFMEVDCQA